MDTEDIKAPSLWIPMTDPVDLAHIGKLGEEAAELSKICHRISIQGIAGIDPSTHLFNRMILQDEIADVFANAGLCISRFKLDVDEISKRERLKKAMKREWHKMLEEHLACNELTSPKASSR